MAENTSSSFHLDQRAIVSEADCWCLSCNLTINVNVMLFLKANSEGWNEKLATEHSSDLITKFIYQGKGLDGVFFISLKPQQEKRQKKSYSPCFNFDIFQKRPEEISSNWHNCPHWLQVKGQRTLRPRKTHFWPILNNSLDDYDINFTQMSKRVKRWSGDVLYPKSQRSTSPRCHAALQKMFTPKLGSSNLPYSHQGVILVSWILLCVR